MATLKELYALIDGIQKVGLYVSEEFLKSVDELEEKIIKEDVLPALSQIIEPQLKEIQRDLVLVVEHHPGEPLRVALSRKANIREMLNAKPLIPTTTMPASSLGSPIYSQRDEYEDNSSGSDMQSSSENYTKGLRITFPDGTVICHRKAIDAFIETLQKIGLEKVSSLGLECSEYNIVSRTQRPLVLGRIWQHKVGDWYVYSNTSTQMKVSLLRKVSDALHLSLKIEALTEETN